MKDRRISGISQGNKSPHHCVRAVPFRVTLKCFLHTRNLKSGPSPGVLPTTGDRQIQSESITTPGQDS